jgi:hypothetical protein
MTPMTSRERMLAAIRREPVDYVPCSPFINPQDYVQRVGHTYGFPFGPSAEEIVTYFVETHGLDMVVGIPWQHYYPAPGVSSTVSMEGDIITKRWKTPAGELTASVRYDEHWPHGYDIPFFTDYTIGRFTRPWLESEADLECLKHILRPPETADELARLEFGHRAATRLAGKYHLATMVSVGMGLTGAQQLIDSAPICLMVVDNPDLVDAYLELEHRNTMKNYEIALDFGVDIVRRNGFYESCDFYSPSMLSSFLKKRINEEARIVHEAERLFGYTVLTGYTPMIDHLASLDLDAILVPDPFFEGEDPAALRNGCGKTKSFWTGPSDTIHMPWDDQKAVAEAVEKTFDIYGKQGLILAACSSAKAIHPWANTLALIEAWKRLR